MSVSAKFRFEIHNIQAIHSQENAAKSDGIYEAAKQFLEEEGLLDKDVVVDFVGKAGYLCAYSTGWVILSQFDTWQPRVSKKWKEMAHRILGDSCDPQLNFEFQDEY
jgi:hypothetical protein